MDQLARDIVEHTTDTWFFVVSDRYVPQLMSLGDMQCSDEWCELVEITPNAYCIIELLTRRWMAIISKQGHVCTMCESYDEAVEAGLRWFMQNTHIDNYAKKLSRFTLHNGLKLSAVLERML